MAIAKMKKVYLIGHQEEKEKTLGILQQMAVVEISDIHAKEAFKEAWAELVEGDQDQESLQRLESRLTEVRFVLDFLNRHFPIKKNILESLGGEKKAITSPEFKVRAAEEWSPVAGAVYSELRKVDEQLMALRNEETRLQNLKTQLLPWQNLDIPLEDIYATAHVIMELGILAAPDFPAFRQNLLEAVPEAFLAEISGDRNDVYVFLAYPTGLADRVREVSKQFSFNRQQFPSLTGTPAENLKRIEEEFLSIEKERKQLLAGVEEEVKHRETLNYYHDYLVMERDKKQVIGNLARTNKAFILEGWMREKDLPALNQKLAVACQTVILVSRDPEKDESFPVALDNPSAVAPFELITTLYGMPKPRGIDPTFALTPFFVMFFGLCMSDAGYGVIMAALAAAALWKLKMGKMVRRAFWIFFAGGLSTVFFGALIGGWFGGLIPLEPLFFNALFDPMRMLLYALGIGIFQIFVGMGIKFYYNIREGKILDAISDQLFWALFIIGLLMLAFPGMGNVARYVAIFSALGLILTQGRAQKGLIRKFLSGVFSLYNVTGFLGDILSYSRLLALGLATSVIAMAVNMLSLMLGGTVVGAFLMVIMLFIGHLFNLLINILGAFVHSCRLQYLEFFSRFFESGGRAFKPFKLNTSYVEVVAELSSASANATSQ